MQSIITVEFLLDKAIFSDQKSYIDDLGTEVDENETAIAGINASLAPVEETSTASRPYAIGDLLMYQNQLYKVASAIAAGGTLTVGTNIVATTVDAEFAGVDEEIARVDGEIAEVASRIPDADDIRVSPEMALTANTYIQDLTYAYSAIVHTIKNGVIELDVVDSGGTNNRGIYITNTASYYTGSASSQVPPLSALLPIDLLKAANYLKTYIESTAVEAILISIYWCNVDNNDTVTTLGRFAQALTANQGATKRLACNPLNIPDNTTHYAMALHRGDLSYLRGKHIKAIPEFCYYPTT